MRVEYVEERLHCAQDGGRGVFVATHLSKDSVCQTIVLHVSNQYCSTQCTTAQLSIEYRAASYTIDSLHCYFMRSVRVVLTCCLV